MSLNRRIENSTKLLKQINKITAIQSRQGKLNEIVKCLPLVETAFHAVQLLQLLDPSERYQFWDEHKARLPLNMGDYLPLFCKADQVRLADYFYQICQSNAENIWSHDIMAALHLYSDARHFEMATICYTKSRLKPTFVELLSHIENIEDIEDIEDNSQRFQFIQKFPESVNADNFVEIAKLLRVEDRKAFILTYEKVCDYTYKVGAALETLPVEGLGDFIKRFLPHCNPQGLYEKAVYGIKRLPEAERIAHYVDYAISLGLDTNIKVLVEAVPSALQIDFIKRQGFKIDEHNVAYFLRNIAPENQIAFHSMLPAGAIKHFYQCWSMAHYLPEEEIFNYTKYYTLKLLQQDRKAVLTCMEGNNLLLTQLLKPTVYVKFCSGVVAAVISDLNNYIFEIQNEKRKLQFVTQLFAYTPDQKLNAAIALLDELHETKSYTFVNEDKEEKTSINRKLKDDAVLLKDDKALLLAHPALSQGRLGDIHKILVKACEGKRVANEALAKAEAVANQAAGCRIM